MPASITVEAWPVQAESGQGKAWNRLQLAQGRFGFASILSAFSKIPFSSVIKK
jgi:hypothetical protein